MMKCDNLLWCSVKKKRFKLSLVLLEVLESTISDYFRDSQSSTWQEIAKKTETQIKQFRKPYFQISWQFNVFVLLGCCTPQVGSPIPKFRENMSVQSARGQRLLDRWRWHWNTVPKLGKQLPTYATQNSRQPTIWTTSERKPDIS